MLRDLVSVSKVEREPRGTKADVLAHSQLSKSYE